MKKKIIPVLFVLVLIILIGAVAVGLWLKEKYSYSNEVLDLQEYFQVKNGERAKNIYAAVREANDGYIFSKSVHGKNLSSQEKEWLLMENENNVWTEVLNKDGSLHYRYKEQIDKFTYCFVDDEGNKQTFTVKEKRVVTYNQNLALKQRKEILKEVNKAKSISVKGLAKEEYGESAYEKNQCVDYNKVAGDGRNKSQESAGVVSESYFHCLLFVSETQNLESSSPELIMYIILRPELVYSGLLLARSDSARAEASGRLLGPS